MLPLLRHDIIIILLLFYHDDSAIYAPLLLLKSMFSIELRHFSPQRLRQAIYYAAYAMPLRAPCCHYAISRDATFSFIGYCCCYYLRYYAIYAI